VDCWSWSELLDLGLGNIPCAKRTWPMPTFWDQAIVNWAFIWCKPWILFEFICYSVFMLIVILTLCLMLCFELIKEYFIWYMRRQRRLLASEIACLDVDIFIWCLDLNNVWILLISHSLLFDPMSKGIWVSIWHSCLLDCIPLVRSFQLLTFNLCLG
jgi:hypothetical protein